jgi:peroxiredoxin
MGCAIRPLPICLFSTIMLSLGARPQETKVEVNFAGVELFENDQGWRVGEVSILTNSPLEKGDVILKVGGQGVAQVGPLSIAALLEYAQIRNLGVVVERAGQEKELSSPSSRAPDSGERPQEKSAMGATFRSVEDTQRIIVTDIVPGSPAERAGLKRDDELLAVGGQAVGSMTLAQLADLLSTRRELAERLQLRRGGHEVDITLKPAYWEQTLKSPVPQRMPFPLHARGEPAPVFTLPDLGGRSVALNSFRGKLVLLTFWSTWCRPCIAESELIDKLHRELGTRLMVLGLDVDDDPKALRQFLQLRRLSYPILIAGEFTSAIPRIYDLGALPLTVLIDPDGFVIYLQTGFSPGGPLESRVRSLVGQVTAN